MFDYVQLVFDCVFLVLFIVIWRAMHFDPADIITSLQKSEAGVASGTARQKKKADELLGEAILEHYPVVKTVAARVPQLGKFCLENKNMVPYVAQVISSIIGGVGQKLPPEIQPFIQGLIGATPGQTSALEQKPRRSDTGWR